VGEAEKVARWYHPALRMDGTPVELGESRWGGQCGVWVDRDGTPIAELAGIETRQAYDEAH
jgi:phytanoyl-CoA hydroxylase